MVEARDIRWEQRYANFRKALRQLKKFVDKGALSDLEEQGAIQAFEYTYELSWNVMKDFLEYQGQTDIYGSRDAIRKAFQLGLIVDGNTWMDAYVSRTKTSHTYNEDTAREVVGDILSRYYEIFSEFERKMMPLAVQGGQFSGSQFGIDDEQFVKILGVLRSNSLVDVAIIYGSRAMGTHKVGSDIDLVLKGKQLTLMELNRICLGLDDLLLPYSFDVTIYHHIDNPDLIAHIERVGKAVYVRQGHQV